jgi:hypothetical protein
LPRRKWKTFSPLCSADQIIVPDLSKLSMELMRIYTKVAEELSEAEKWEGKGSRITTKVI